MERFKLEFILHWMWAAVLAVLMVTGLALLGPKYGWVMKYNLAFADYLHRTMAVVLVVLFFVEIIFELWRLIFDNAKRDSWLVVGKKGFQLFTFTMSWVIILSGILIWYCTEQEHGALALASSFHELATFILIAGVVWHIYEKSHVLVLGGGSAK